MRTFGFICVGLLLALLGVTARADTFQLNDGQTLNGEVIATSANDAGVQIRIDEGKYPRVAWENFSQEDLKKFKENPKFAPFVEPLIEIAPGDRVRAPVTIKEWAHFERPASRSLLGAMFSSGPGVLALLLLFAANLYAAYEVAIFRARPVALVCGVSVVAPLIGPIIFLCMPSAPRPETLVPPPETPLPQQTFAVPLEPEAQAAETGGLRLATEPAGPFGAAPGQGVPKTQLFQRGAFTFNRRFFETRFAGFFGVVRRDAEKDLQLIVKAARGEYTATRISRITANEMHLQVERGTATEEIMVTFSDIQEVQLKHKDAT